MILPKHLVTVILFILVVEIRSGVIDNILGRVKNTTSALTQDARNVWSYSKSIVGIETPADNRTEEEKRGFIGGIFHTTREKVHNVRNYFWNTDANTNDAGIVGNMYTRVKNKLSKVKGSLLGHNQIQPQPPSENEKLIQKTLDKLFFGNGTREVHGQAFQEAIENLRRKLQEIRNNVKKGMETPVNHGEGLIDVRAVAINTEYSIGDKTPSVANDVYDAVHENLDRTRDETEKSYSSFKNDGNKAVTTLTYGVNIAADQLNVIKDKAFDAANKENELIGNGYNKISAGASGVRSSVQNTVEDAKRLSY